MSERIVRVGKAHSVKEKVMPANSLVAGENQANHMARIYLYELLEETTINKPFVDMHQFVDDMVMRVVVTVARLKHYSLEAIQDLVEGLNKLKLTVAPKSRLVSAPIEVAKQVQQELSQRGILVTVSNHAKDLGVDATAGGLRSTITSDKRLAQARLRGGRGVIFASGGAARNLFSTGACVKAIYAGPVTGLAPHAVRKLEAAAALMAGLGQAMKCTATAMLVAFDRKEPWYRAICQTVVEFIKIWQGRPDMRKGIGVSWRRSRRWVLKTPASARWRTARGPISLLVLQLYELDWNPMRPSRWKDGEGNVYEFVTDLILDFDCIKEALWRSVEKALWRRAAARPEATGLENGGDVTVVRKFAARHRKKGNNAKATLAEVIASDGIWTQQKKFDAGLVGSPLCPRCKVAPETKRHRAYGCICNDDLDLKVDEKIKERAGKDLDVPKNECFWLRGIIPKAWIEDVIKTMEPDAGKDNLIFATGDAAGLQLGERLDVRRAYTDGALTSVYKELQHGTWGVAILNKDETEAKAGWYGTCCADTTSSSSAEIQGATRAIQFTEGSLEIVTDSDVLVNGVRDGKHKIPQKHLALQWKMLGEAIEQHDGEVTFTKCCSHLDLESLMEQPELGQYVVGNAIADAYADLAKDCFTTTFVAEKNLGLVHSYAWTILDRLVSTTMAVIDKVGDDKEVVIKKPKAKSTAALTLEAGHQLRKAFGKHGGRWWCTKCRSGPVRGQRVRAWLIATGKCEGTPKSTITSTMGVGVIHRTAEQQPLQVGNRYVHKTHAVACYRGAIWCWSCGSFASGYAQRLANPCVLKCEGSRLDLRNRILRGDTPRPGTPWPQELRPEEEFPIVPADIRPGPLNNKIRAIPIVGDPGAEHIVEEPTTGRAQQGPLSAAAKRLAALKERVRSKQGPA